MGGLDSLPHPERRTAKLSTFLNFDDARMHDWFERMVLIPYLECLSES
jgi:hypothetical protein